MPNPHPTQSEAFRNKQFKRVQSYKLSSKTISLKLPIAPVNVHEIIKDLPAETRRKMLIEGLYRHGHLTADQLDQLGYRSEKNNP